MGERRIPTDAWELEAERRREVIRADFRRSGRETATPDVAPVGAGRLARMIDSMTATRARLGRTGGTATYGDAARSAIEPGT
jgi:hypothetical protein